MISLRHLSKDVWFHCLQGGLVNGVGEELADGLRHQESCDLVIFKCGHHLIL